MKSLLLKKAPITAFNFRLSIFRNRSLNKSQLFLSLLFLLTFAFQSFSQVDTDLVGYWKMDQNSGTIVSDETDNGLNGTFVGSLSFTESAAFSGAGNALSFTGGYVSVPHNAVINEMQNSMTIEAWIFQTDNANNTIVDRGNYNFLFETNPNGQPGLGFYNPNGGWSYSTSNIPVNQWVHVAMTWGGSTKTLKFYTNGKLTDTFIRPSALFFNDSELNIGRQQPDGCRCNLMNGQIDELRLWKTVRSEPEIQAAINVIPDTTPPFVDFGSEFTIELDENGRATVTVDAVGGDDFDDNGEPLTFAFSQADFDCSDIVAPTEVTITVTNVAGISASTVMNAIVVDKLGPTLVTNHVVVQLDAEGNGSYTLEDIFNTDTRDNCGGPISFQGAGTVNRDDVVRSPFEEVVKGTDQNGNTTRTRATITVLDYVEEVVPPVFTSTPITSINDDQEYRYTIAAEDRNGESVSVTASELPAWLTLVSQAGGTVSTVAGSGQAGFINNTGGLAEFNAPAGVAVDANGNIFVADQNNHVIRRIDAEGLLYTYAGNGMPGFIEGPTDYASFHKPAGLVLDNEGNLIVADSESHSIRRVTPDGLVLTVAGTGWPGFVNGDSTMASFHSPMDVAVDAEGNIFVADQGNHVIRKIDTDGRVSTYAGDGMPGFIEGPADYASFHKPAGLALDNQGNLIVADSESHSIRRVTPDGLVITVAGTGWPGFINGDSTMASFHSPKGVAVDAGGNIFVSDQGNQVLRKIDTDGRVSTFAGSGIQGLVSGSNSDAGFNNPQDLAFDSQGNLIVADSENNAIRILAPGQTELVGNPGGQSGVYTVTLNANDTFGETIEQTFNITVNDVTAPTIVTQNISIELGADGSVSITPEQIDNGSSDNAGGELTYTLDRADFSCNELSASCSGSSLAFAGTGIASGANGDNIQNLGLNQLTMEAWVKPNGGTVNSIIRKAGDYDLYIVNNTLYAEVWYEGRASSIQYLYAGPTVPSSGWSHLAFTFDKANNGSGKFYVNGVETVATGTVRSIAPDITLGIGGSTEFGQSFTGLIDDVRIWSTERTNAQINEFKDFCIDASAVGLEAYFKIEANEGTTLTDYSGNGNHLTIEGTSWSTEGAPIESKGVEVTLTVTDESNNASSAIANVIVLDNIAPTLIGVPADVTVECSDVPTVATVSAADNCTTNPVVNFTEERIEGISNNNYVLIRTWTTTDGSGNIASGTQVITVEDNIDPSITLNGDALIFHDAYADYIDLGATASDNCSTAEVSADSPVNTDTPGAYIVTYTATDDSGNQAIVTRTVIVRDITSPTIATQPVIVSLDAAGTANISSNDVVINTSDDSNTVNLTLSDTDFECDDLGDQTVLVSAEDGNGNGLAISQNGLVGYWKFGGANPLVDLTGNWGDIEFVGNASLNNGALDLNANGFARTSGYSGNTITSKTLISYIALKDLNVRSGAAISIDGITTDNFDAIVYAERQVRRWMNGSSNFRRTQDLNPGFAETQTDQLIQMAITYENIGSQVIVTLYRNGVNIGGYTSANASNWTPGNMEILFGARHSTGNTQFGSLDARINKALLYNRALSAQEIAAMNGASVTVSVVDEIAPVITAPADINVLATSASGAVVNYATPVGTDNCSVTTALISGFADGATFPIGTTVVAYTTTDGSGNTASTSFNVEVSGLAPEIITPSNITVSTDAGECGAIVAYVATETTAIPASTITYDIASGSSFGLGTTIVTATASNAVGTSTKTFTVTVEDNIVPSIIAPADISIFATSPSGAVVNYLTPVGIDNCLVTTVLTTGLADGATFPIGNTVVTYTATDVSGNSTAASFNVEVSGLAPEIITPANITVSKDAGQCRAIVDYTATETTAIPASVITYDIPPGSNFAVGTTTVTSTATNAVGTSSKTFTVTVVDDENPNAITQDLTVELDANGSATINASQVDNGSSDECGIQSITLDKTTFDCSNLGANAVTLTVMDVNGNVSLAEATVMVVDVIVPTVITKDITVALDADGVYTVKADDINNGTFDNCTFDLSVDNNSFDCSTLGEHTVTLTATDANGNSNSASATVTVVDNAGPVIIAKDIDVYLDEDGNASITLDDVNESITDVCGVTGTTIDITSFDCSNLGANTVILTATDIHGNISTGTATITVIDDIAPTVITKNITVDLDANGNATINPIDVLVQEEITEYCSVANANGYGMLLYQYVKRYRNRPARRATGFVFSARGRTFRKNPDGTATITGTLRDRSDAGDSWSVRLNLKNARDWEEWSALGNTFAGNRTRVGDKYLDWTYYELGEGSRLIGTGRNRGETIQLVNRGGFQVGEGANARNSNLGISGQFRYTTRRGRRSSGRFNFDLENCISSTKEQTGPITDDNCGIASTSLDITSFDCISIGDNIVNVTVKDKSGNATTVPVTVTVRDVTIPVARAKDITVILEADGTVTIDPMLLDGGSTDNCGIVSYSLSKDTFTCRDIQYQSYYRRGQNVTLTVTDAAGNSSRAVASVYVTERQAPVISTEPITLVVYGRQRAQASRREISKRVTDNCGVQRLYHQRRWFSRSNAGLNNLWVVAIDNSGNRTNGFVRVNVVDITKYGRVVPMCYRDRPIRVRNSQVQRWLSRGASLGTCSTDITMAADETNLNQQIAEPEPVHEPIIELGAYPNPSQGMTNITFSSDVAGPAQMVVVSTGGVRMATLFDGDITADENVKVRYNTNDLPSGMYIIRLVTAGEIRSLKLLVRK